MFDIKFYITDKKINSTLIPSNAIGTFSCTIKNASSTLSPKIELRHDNPTSFNYCYIQEFNRYYFINDWTFDMGLWVASTQVDVLATYKTQIGNSTKYILRSASNKNLNVKDNMYSNLDYYTFNEQINNDLVTNYSNGYYVVGVVGTNVSTGGTNYYEMSPVQFANLLNDLFVSADGYAWGDLTQGMINSLMNPFQYITSAMWFPFSVGAFGTGTISVGNWTTNTTASKVIGTTGASSIASFTIPKHPKSSIRGQYLNDKPFTKYVLDWGYFGLLDLPNELMFNKTILAIGRRIDFATGLCNFEIYATDDNQNSVTLASLDVQVGVNIPLSSDTLHGIGQILSGGVDLLTGALTENPLSVISGATDLIGGGLSLMAPSISTKGSQGSIINANKPLKFRSIFYDIVDNDNTNLGSPLCENRTINTLSGYLICEEGNIQCNGTSQEKQQINSLLTSGIYYE